jgi:hypothetical protein
MAVARNTTRILQARWIEKIPEVRLANRSAHGSGIHWPNDRKPIFFIRDYPAFQQDFLRACQSYSNGFKLLQILR